MPPTTRQELVAEVQEPVRLDVSWVLPLLGVGGRIHPGAMQILTGELACRRIVDLRAEEQDDSALMTRYEVHFLSLPTRDHHSVAPEKLWEGVRWVTAGLSCGERVLIHCEYGIGRSVVLACCVLVSLGHTPQDALRKIKLARRIVCPSPDQLHALLDWSAEWYKTQNAPCPDVSCDDLTAIAYHVCSRS